jgi:hypothetical protein
VNVEKELKAREEKGREWKNLINCLYLPLTIYLCKKIAEHKFKRRVAIFKVICVQLLLLDRPDREKGEKI